MTEICFRRAHDRALVRVAGRDARQFLHAQTTQNLADLPGNETRLAAWLTPQGRVRALFDVVPEGNTFWLATAADSADWLAEQLGRYVLRADVTLAPATDHAVYSLLGDSRGWLQTRGIAVAVHGVAAGDGDGALWFRIAADRVDIIAQPDRIEPELAGLPAASSDAAALAAIAAGRPDIPAAMRDKYVAQMLNLDRLNAVSFAKGCYPGQEIVARTHNLGEVKRRLERFRCGPGPRPVAGGIVVDADGKPQGEINRSAATGDDGYELLAVTRIDAAHKALALESDGRGLEPLPLS